MATKKQDDEIVGFDDGQGNFDDAGIGDVTSAALEDVTGAFSFVTRSVNDARKSKVNDAADIQAGLDANISTIINTVEQGASFDAQLESAVGAAVDAQFATFPFKNQLENLVKLITNENVVTSELDPLPQVTFDEVFYVDRKSASVSTIGAARTLDPDKLLSGGVVTRDVEGLKANGVVSPTPLLDVGLPGGKLVRYADDDQIDSDTPTFILDALIYIQGVEISNHVLGSISVSKNTIDGQNRVTFVLENSDDRFIWAERNLRSVIPSTDPQVATSLFSALEKNKSIFGANEDIKKQVFTYKAFGQNSDGTPINPLVVNEKNTPMFPRFDLAPNKAIFARMDPIRVFTLYPFRAPTSTDRELWMPEFTGYVENVSIEDDDVSGSSRITIEATCYVQSVLRRMRISTDLTSGLANPLDNLGFRPLGLGFAGTDPNAVQGPESAQVTQQAAAAKDWRYFDNKVQFYDDIISSVFGQEVYPNLSMEGAITELLVFKPERLNDRNGNRGARNITLGGSFYYPTQTTDPSVARAFLNDYHTFCLFGPKRRPWTREEVDEVGKRTTTTGAFNPNNCRLWFLLPQGGSGSKNTADLSTVSCHLTHEVNWRDRAEVLRNLVASIDYRMMVSPCGDLICEFPMADFRPEDFGDFKSSFRVNKALKSTNFGDEQGDPIAGLIITTGFGAAAGVPSSPIAEAAYTKAFAFSPIIAARYGITTETIPLPFLLSSDKAIAQQRALIEFQKRNAQCNALQMTFSYRPFLLPNRPIHHLRRTRMGIIVTVDSTITLDASANASCDVGLEHVRTWTGVYRTVDALSSLTVQQKLDLQKAGVNAGSPTAIAGIDLLASPDLTELQVFTNVMGGENMATSPRFGWGKDNNDKQKAIVAPAAGVFLVQPAFLSPPDTSSSDLAADTAGSQATEEDETPPGEPDRRKWALPTTDALQQLGSRFGFRNDPFGGSEKVNHPLGSADKPKTDTRGKFHAGIDIRCPTGTPLFAVEDGTVIEARKSVSAGNLIRYVLKDGTRISCMHLSVMSVAKGATVTRGQQIGLTGATGKATGPHLHFEVLLAGASSSTDPLPFLTGEALPPPSPVTT